MIDMVNYLKLMQGCFSNALIMYRIPIIKPVKIVSREKKNSNLTLIKYYFRSTMLQ